MILGVAGPIENMKLSYRSDPPLRFDEIVALLATGKVPASDPTIAAHQEVQPQQSLTQMGESAIVSQAVAAPLANRIQRVFGVNQIKIDPTFTSGSALPQARITLQQQISGNIIFTYTTDLTQTNSQILRVEWAVSPRVSAIATRDENGLFGVDFYIKRQFRKVVRFSAVREAEACGTTRSEVAASASIRSRPDRDRSLSRAEILFEHTDLAACFDGRVDLKRDLLVSQVVFHVRCCAFCNRDRLVRQIIPNLPVPFIGLGGLLNVLSRRCGGSAEQNSWHPKRSRDENLRDTLPKTAARAKNGNRFMHLVTPRHQVSHQPGAHDASDLVHQVSASVFKVPGRTQTSHSGPK